MTSSVGVVVFVNLRQQYLSSSRIMFPDIGYVAGHKAGKETVATIQGFLKEYCEKV